MKAREIIAQLVRTSIIPVLRPAGFTTAGFSLHRRRNTIVQVVNVQLSDANFGEQGRFYINIGLNFDPVCMLEGKPILAKPKEYECQFRRRLDQIVSDAPAQWAFNTRIDGDGLAPALRASCEYLLIYLNHIDSIESFLVLNWINGGAEWGLLAQLQYVLGHHHAAVVALQQLHASFQTRPTWSLARWIERLGLVALKPELDV